MAWSQNDNRWKNQTLGFGPGEIGPYGCFLTAFANICTWAGQNVTPLALNGIMKQRGYFTGDLVNNHQAPNLIYPQNLEWVGETHWDTTPAQSTPLSFFDDVIDPSLTYAILIDASPKPGVQTHFVQVVGRATNDLIIDDSWDGIRKKLSLYGNPTEIIQAAYKYRKRGAVMQLATDEEIARITYHLYYPKAQYPLVWPDPTAFTNTLGYLRGNTPMQVFDILSGNAERNTYMQALSDIGGPFAARDKISELEATTPDADAAALKSLVKKIADE